MGQPRHGEHRGRVAEVSGGTAATHAAALVRLRALTDQARASADQAEDDRRARDAQLWACRDLFPRGRLRELGREMGMSTAHINRILAAQAILHQASEEAGEDPGGA